MHLWRANQRLKSDFTWVFFGNLVYFGCQWGIVLALAKLGSAAQVGEYALGMAVAAPVVLFANLQLRSLAASDVQDRFSFGEYLRFRAMSLTVALVAIAMIVAVMAPGWRKAEIILLVGLAQALEYLSDCFYAWMQKYERMERIALSLMMKGPLSLGALAVTMYFTRSVVWSVVALLAGRCVILLAWDMRLGFAKLDWSAPVGAAWPVMRTLLRMALPLGVISMLVSLNSNIPRYFLESYSGAAGLGIYSAIASLLSAGTLVISAMGQSIFLPVARACAAADRAGYRSSVLLAAASAGTLGAVGVFAASLFGRQILRILFRPEYAAHADVFVLLMVAGMIGFIGSGAGWVMTAARSLKEQIPLLIATGVAATAVSALLIPRFGLMGAGAAMLASSVVQLTGSGLILWGIDRRMGAEHTSATPVNSEAGA